MGDLQFQREKSWWLIPVFIPFIDGIALIVKGIKVKMASFITTGAVSFCLQTFVPVASFIVMIKHSPEAETIGMFMDKNEGWMTLFWVVLPFFSYIACIAVAIIMRKRAAIRKSVFKFAKQNKLSRKSFEDAVSAIKQFNSDNVMSIEQN